MAARTAGIDRNVENTSVNLSIVHPHLSTVYHFWIQIYQFL